MVGTVAATGKPLLTADVTQQDNWLANRVYSSVPADEVGARQRISSRATPTAAWRRLATTAVPRLVLTKVQVTISPGSTLKIALRDCGSPLLGVALPAELR